MISDPRDSSELKKFTIYLDLFDHKVITLIAREREQSPSDIINNLIHQWIENHPDILMINYDIDINNLATGVKISSRHKFIQNSFKKFENYLKSQKSSELHLITLNLSKFDERVITLMAGNSRRFPTKIIRKIVHEWIEKNSDIIKSNYNININDVAREIVIEKLIKYSELFNKIEIDVLAGQLEISKKILRDIIFEYKYKLEKLGVKLRIRGKLIVREWNGEKLMSVGKPRKIYNEIMQVSYENHSAKDSDILQLIIPFSQIFKTYKLIDVYSGNQTIPFNERDPEYKLILRQEFSEV